MTDNGTHLMETAISVTPLSPIIARDGRSFGAGDRMHSLDWVYPSTFVGALRTLIGKQNHWNFDPAEIDKLIKIEVTGPFPCVGETLYFPKPLDCVVRDENGQGIAYFCRPQKPGDGEGTDAPNGLWPVMPKVEEDFKPVSTAGFWSMDYMIQWLFNQKDQLNQSQFPTISEKPDKDHAIHLPQKDNRVHIAIDPNTGCARDTMLFSTSALDMTLDEKASDTIRLYAQVKFNDTKSSQLDTLHPLGGERRLARWIVSHEPKLWESMKERLTGCQFHENHVRMVLATPAIFKDGWKPGWLKPSSDGHLEGSPLGSDLKLRLVGTSIGRWMPISGWCYESGKAKAVRRMVPAGSVYFFTLEGGKIEHLCGQYWLQSVCDDDQDRRDGFGATLWGTW